MTLPQPSNLYSVERETERNRLIQVEDSRNQKRTLDHELVGTARLILHSPNGARWNITVSNAGTIAAVAL